MHKSPSEHMLSISEEQSTRKHNHLKSGSLPDFLPHKGQNTIEMNSARLAQGSDSERRSFSLLDKDGDTDDDGMMDD